MFKNGDLVQLKSPQNGRYFKGRVSKISKTEAAVTLPNGYFVVQKLDDLQLIDILPAENEDETEIIIEEEI